MRSELRLAGCFSQIGAPSLSPRHCQGAARRGGRHIRRVPRRLLSRLLGLSGEEGAPFDRGRVYRVGYPFPEIFAENGPASIRNYFTAHPDKLPPEDAARGGQEFLLQHWAHAVWKRVWAALDVDHDGAVTAAEFAALDVDASGAVDAREMLRFLRTRLGMDASEGEAAFALHVLRAGGDRDQDGKLTWREFQGREE